MNCRLGIGILLGSVFIAACSSMQPKPRELPFPAQRVFQNAYSFMPPNEIGWLVAARNPHHLAFARAGSNPDETFGIQARVIRISDFASSEEFVRIVKDSQAADTDPKRFRVLKHDVTPDDSKKTTCARSHLVAEDTAAVKRTATPGDMILEGMILVCAHPKDARWAVNLVYSHRYYPGQADARFAEKAAHVLSSVEFLE